MIPRLAMLLLAGVAACAPGPIVWDDQVVAMSVRGNKTPETAPRFANQCAVAAAFTDTQLYAAWWSLKPDSSADLVASTSKDGVHWSAPVKVDTTDVGRMGCERPAPSLFADGDNLQVVYSMKAREGPGIFLSHSMDRAGTFHSPVAVVYGERLGRTSVAARGNLVVVAYEDPNTTPTRISVALSTTMAHLFEYREVVSPQDAPATAPWVYLNRDTVEVSWYRGDDLHDKVGKRGRIR